MNRPVLSFVVVGILATIAMLLVGFPAASGQGTPYLYGKGVLADKTLEVVSVGGTVCSGNAYTVREVGQTPTFDVSVLNRTYSLGAYIYVHGYISASGCTPLPSKYSLIEQ